jgi:tetratricopeptide (TPR) repeat protein
MIGPTTAPTGPDEWEIVIPTDDASITRRRRALAPIQVLADIERTKVNLDGDFWHRYDLFNIALAVIDQVALAMGISAGRTWDETLDYAVGQAARQAPDANQQQWRTVAERVLVSLVTTDVETVPYLVHTHRGPDWRAQRFRLLYVHASRDGQEYLRASEQAINIFVEALDIDVEAAQIANEAQLSALIARGAVESAVQIARHARYRSIQYQERIRRIVADTLIDPDAHDWIGDVPSLLDQALAHVRERLDAEAALLDAVADRRAELEDRARVRAANQLLEILRECRHRHDELHGHLIGARSRLREVLDDRFARPPGSVRRADLGTELLGPYLTRSTKACAALAARLLATVGGVSTRWWPSLTVLTDELCAPGRTLEPGEEYFLPEFDSVDQPEWWEAYEDTTEALLNAIDEPTRLSQLVARAQSAAHDVVDTDGQPLEASRLVESVIHVAHRAWAASLAGRPAGDRVVVGVTTGEAIDTGNIHSADLLLVPGVVAVDIDEPAPSHATRTHDPLAEDAGGVAEEVLV